DDVSAQGIDFTSTQLNAQIDPHGADTHYFFEYGTADCSVSPSSCTDVPASPGADLGSGFGDQRVSVVLRNLQPGATYFYRVIAQNKDGTAADAPGLHVFRTLPSPVGILPDGRNWELVSPPDKH